MEFRLAVPYAEKDAAKLAARAAGGFLKWHPEDKVWIYVGQHLPESLSAYDPSGLKTWVLDVPFMSKEWAIELGARWRPDLKSFVFAGRRLPESLRMLAAKPYSFEAMLQRRVCPEALEETRSGDGSIVPREHQTICSAAIARAWNTEDQPGFLNSDDVGLGKTIETWDGILKTDAMSVLIVSPLSGMANWRKTLKAMGDGGKEVVLINYDRLRKLFEAGDKLTKDSLKKKSGAKRKLKRSTINKRLAEYGVAMKFDIVVFDEAHKMGNPTSQRAKFGRSLENAADFAIWLTATAGSDPLQLSYLSSLLAWRTGQQVEDLDEFEKWCQSQGIGVVRGKFGRWSWEKNEADLDRIADLLFAAGANAGIRRLPSDIAGWPEVNRMLWPVELSDEQMSAYRDAWSEFAAARGIAAQGRDSSNGLVAQLRFRQKCSILRVEHTADLADTLIEQGRKVAISVQFIESLDRIAELLKKMGYSCVEYSGRITKAECEASRVAFQQGDADVVLFTVEDAISFHEGEYPECAGSRRPRSQIIHDLRWSALSMKQIEGRTHRDGKFSQMYWMMGADTVEERLCATVAERVRNMKRMHGDKFDETLADIERVLATNLAAAA